MMNGLRGHWPTREEELSEAVSEEKIVSKVNNLLRSIGDRKVVKGGDRDIKLPNMSKTIEFATIKLETVDRFDAFL